MHNAHSRRIYVGDCFVPGFFWHKTNAGINVALTVFVITAEFTAQTVLFI